MRRQIDAPWYEPAALRHRQLCAAAGVERDMQPISYYREQAERGRRLARSQNSREVQDTLRRMAQDYDDIAEDLENGAIEIRHPELMPQRRR
jgi:hypothetical protein